MSSSSPTALPPTRKLALVQQLPSRRGVAPGSLSSVPVAALGDRCGTAGSNSPDGRSFQVDVVAAGASRPLMFMATEQTWGVDRGQLAPTPPALESNSILCVPQDG